MIKHVDVRRIDGRVIVAVYNHEMRGWARVTFELDDERRVFCTVEISGRGTNNKVTIAPDFVAVGDSCVVTIWNEKATE